MKKSSRPDRILVTQPYGIGDALFMLPFLKALKEERGAETVDVILGSRTRQILEHCPYVDEIFVIDKDKWRAQGKLKTLREKWRLFLRLREKSYTLFADLSMQPEYGFWAKFLLAIPLRIGFNYKNRNRFLNNPLHLPQDGFSGKNMIEYFSDLARLAGVEIRDKKPTFSLPSLFLERAGILLASRGYQGRCFIAVAPGGGVTWGKDASRKHWPLENFGRLMGLLRQEGFVFDAVVVLGIKEEQELGEALRKIAGVPVVNLCGETDLMLAAAVLKMSRLFIGNDGGLVHLASSQNAPIIALYGPADPRVYGSYPDSETTVKVSKKLACQPCYKSFRYDETCRTLACLKELTAEEVMRLLRESGFLRRLTSFLPESRPAPEIQGRSL